MTRRAFVAEARRWIGTPYRHAGSAKGIGCDCLGLLAGVARAVLGPLALPPVPPYPPDWAEAGGTERLAEALAVHCVEIRHDDGCAGIAAGDFAPGQIVLFRWREGRPASHLAIATGEGTLIHAHVRAVVAEVVLTPSWRRRVAGLFALAELS